MIENTTQLTSISAQNPIDTHLYTSLNRLPVTRRKTAAERKYSEAVEMYATTTLPISRIAKKCHVSPAGLSAHISRYHRELLFARYGLNPDASEFKTLRVKPRKGQTPKSYRKYKEAIEACSDLAYIEFNVSQVARLFNLDGTSLASQLRVHYPNVIEDREKLRRSLGIADNFQRGPRKWSKDTYTEALEMYRDTDKTIPEVADACQVSISGLTQYLRFYHQEIIDIKSRRRASAKQKVGHRKPGKLAGNGNTYGPRPETVEKYAKALELYRTTSLTLREITSTTGVTYSGFCGYLMQWHKGEKLRRRGYDWDGESDVDLSASRPFRKSTAGKYAAAIESLKQSPRPVAAVAEEFGHNPDVFRDYLKKHEPELVSLLGMTRRSNGKLVKMDAAEKYEDAVREYATTTEPLKSIARRLGLVYNSLCNYITRNCLEERTRHQRLLEESDKKKS